MKIKTIVIKPAQAAVTEKVLELNAREANFLLQVLGPLNQPDILHLMAKSDTYSNNPELRFSSDEVLKLHNHIFGGCEELVGPRQDGKRHE